MGRWSYFQGLVYAINFESLLVKVTSRGYSSLCKRALYIWPMCARFNEIIERNWRWRIRWHEWLGCYSNNATYNRFSSRRDPRNFIQLKCAWREWIIWHRRTNFKISIDFKNSSIKDSIEEAVNADPIMTRSLRFKCDCEPLKSYEELYRNMARRAKQKTLTEYFHKI